MSNSRLRTLGWILLVVGVAAIVVGVVYFTVAADKLPAFLGRLAHKTGHRHKRAIAALAAGVLLWIGAAVAFVRARRRRS
jgi:preprotein translocase subunit SecY